MTLDPFRMCIASLPLAVYLLLLGLVNLSRRPIMTTGASDLAALGAGISGLITIGPLELFLPEVAVVRFGHAVWLFVLALYILSVLFLVLASRPRLVIYNIRGKALRPLLADVVASLDRDARWAGNSLDLPNLGVHLYLESLPLMRHVSLLPSGSRQNFSGWRSLESALDKQLKLLHVSSNPIAFCFLAGALLLLTGCLAYMLSNPLAAPESWHEIPTPQSGGKLRTDIAS